MTLRPLLCAALVVSALVACSQPSLIGAEEPAADVSEVNDDEEKKAATLERFERDGSVFDSAPPEGSGEGTLLFQPSLEYSGFDGEHTFKVPISIHGSGSDLVLTADDPSAVTIAKASLVDATGDKGLYYMITPKKAGLVTLTARSRGQTAEAEIHVASYAPSRWAAGEKRYLEGGGGAPPCAQCHGGGEGIDHSPAAIASITDAEVARIVTAGEKPGFVPIEGVKHAWEVSDAERQGLVTYLRGLDPRGFR
ncbi:MAG: cytochrome c [Labilithrix sp.]|nr:cytochrome c [Labilithrix sp.]MCW5815201.1 cytochrome c [Labilithrix sp.]